MCGPTKRFTRRSIAEHMTAFLALTFAALAATYALLDWLAGRVVRWLRG